MYALYVIYKSLNGKYVLIINVNEIEYKLHYNLQGLTIL